MEQSNQHMDRMADDRIVRIEKDRSLNAIRTRGYLGKVSTILRLNRTVNCLSNCRWRRTMTNNEHEEMSVPEEL